MERPTESAEHLRAQIADLEKQLEDLTHRLARVEASQQDTSPNLPVKPRRWPLDEAEYERYGRQLILSSVGIRGQLRLKAASVLLVGAGGLGCPAAAYLAGAGIGTIGLVDGDNVEASNLHRQIAHATTRIGDFKVDSAISYLNDLNTLPTYKAHRTHLTPQNAVEIISSYDVVLDCTDHPTSRYLISDACVLLRKPLVSASALRTDGQLVVLNSPAAPQGDTSGGPCYRCVFPRPPPPDAVVSCGEGGILGPVVGVMGVLQALEALRLIASGRHLPPPSQEGEGVAVPPPVHPSTLLLFSAPADGAPASFRSVRMRGRRVDCFACGGKSNLSLAALRDGLLDYVQFCGGATQPVVLLRPDERISATEYHGLLQQCEQHADGGQGDGAAREGHKRTQHLLLDVREREHFDIASIPGAVNVPFSKTQALKLASETSPAGTESRPSWLPKGVPDDAPIYVVCRVGNDSQTIARQLKDLGLDLNGKRFVGDIKGGMRAWKEEVDHTLPFT